VIDTGSSVPPQAELHLLSHAGRPLEDWVSRRAIRAAFVRAGGPDTADVKEIAERARAGDRAAALAFGGAFEVLGEVLGPWLQRFRAELVVVGGSISRSWDLIEQPLRTGLSHSSDWRAAIETAAWPELSPLVGAAYPAARSSSG
ncbi:MAG TPA: ROK family protein, partial [Jatrophihabitans sp.]